MDVKMYLFVSFLQTKLCAVFWILPLGFYNNLSELWLSKCGHCIAPGPPFSLISDTLPTFESFVE